MDSTDAPLPTTFEAVMAARRRSSGGEETSRMELILLLRRAWAMANDGALFSTQEELDDVATKDLKYLLLPYYLAEALEDNSRPDFESREEDLRSSTKALDEFLSICSSYGIAGADRADLENEGEMEDPQTVRQRKVEDYKREKMIQKKIEELESRKRCTVGVRREEELTEDEDDERETWILQIEDAIIKALRMKSSHAKEIQVLEFAKTEGSLEPQKRGEADFPTTITPLRSKVRVSREEVFRPPHRLPTVSVEEYGEMMKKQMLDDAKSRASFAEKHDDWDEDDEEEEKLRKARAWDDWKDDHRRGEGNSRLNPCGR